MLLINREHHDLGCDIAHYNIIPCPFMFMTVFNIQYWTVINLILLYSIFLGEQNQIPMLKHSYVCVLLNGNMFYFFSTTLAPNFVTVNS